LHLLIVRNITDSLQRLLWLELPKSWLGWWVLQGWRLFSPFQKSLLAHLYQGRKKMISLFTFVQKNTTCCFLFSYAKK